MKKLFALLFVASFSSQALTIDPSVNFIGADTSTETNLCVVVAHSGVQASKYAADNNVESTLCNNDSAHEFSTKYQKLLPRKHSTTYAKI